MNREDLKFKDECPSNLQPEINGAGITVSVMPVPFICC